MKIILPICFALAFAISSHIEAKTHRSHSAKVEFKKENLCPANGRSKGRCPGYVIDHIIPLCAGGADRPSNMQWQTKEDAKVKDREEKNLCLMRFR